MDILIKKATPDNSEIAAELIYMTFLDFSHYMFGVKTKADAIEYFKQMWIDESNRMSYKYAHLALNNGNAVGLLSSYSGKSMERLFPPTILYLIRKHPKWLFHLVRNFKSLITLMSNPEASSDEYLIFMLAVLPEHQNKGIGSRLLDLGHELARKEGFRKCSLLVRSDNIDAQRFYERNGYVKEKTYKYSKAPFIYHKMVKEL